MAQAWLDGETMIANMSVKYSRLDTSKITIEEVNNDIEVMAAHWSVRLGAQMRRYAALNRSMAEADHICRSVAVGSDDGNENGVVIPKDFYLLPRLSQTIQNMTQDADFMYKLFDPVCNDILEAIEFWKKSTSQKQSVVMAKIQALSIACLLSRSDTDHRVQFDPFIGFSQMRTQTYDVKQIKLTAGIANNFRAAPNTPNALSCFCIKQCGNCGDQSKPWLSTCSTQD
ncbi:hypothetical protein LTR84_007841 [Exophiala bonariae]|uniref:Uncharacterized protein n=1 Tax=Exophiala bonariae TaxID=1690606 RepID=A0AAV9NLB5_9EURO|nr:hypothetical protein LTR84_007841 [Exophiala bonariae]